MRINRRTTMCSLFLWASLVMPVGVIPARDEAPPKRKSEPKADKSVRPEAVEPPNGPVSGADSAKCEKDGGATITSEDSNTGSNLPAHPSMATQQQSGSGAPPAPPAVTSPGTDAAAYVPGSSVGNFRQMHSFKLGPILFRPSGRIHYFYESNLLATSGQDSATHAILIEPTIEALLPVTQNGIRLDYSLLYRNYGNYELRHKVAHHFNADSQFDFTPIFNVGVREHFALSSLESSEFVPGREVIFSDAQFKRNDISTQANWDMTDGNTLSLRGDWNRVSFDESNTTGERPFYDYDQYNLGGTYKRELSQRTSAFGGATYLRDVTDDPRGLATSRGFETVAGVDSQITPLMSGQFSVGFRSQTFGVLKDQNYRGAVLRGSLQKDLTPTIRLGVSGSRSTNISNFERNAFYLTHGIGFSYSHVLRSNFLLTVNPGYQRNTYPQPLSSGSGQNRVDRIFDLLIAARYRLNSLLGIEARYDYIRRRSVLPELNFSNYRAGVSLLIGQRGITQGRAPY